MLGFSIHIVTSADHLDYFKAMKHREIITIPPLDQRRQALNLSSVRIDSHELRVTINECPRWTTSQNNVNTTGMGFEAWLFWLRTETLWLMALLGREISRSQSATETDLCGVLFTRADFNC